MNFTSSEKKENPATEDESQAERGAMLIRTVSDGAERCYLLDKGNFGLLTRAECQSTMKKCWIQTFERNEEERVQLVRSLDHPNLLRMLDVFEDGAHCYAVYEATEGGGAEELCARTGGLSEQWTAAIMRQVFTALSYCHSKGLVLKTLSVKHVLFTKTPTEEHISVKLLVPLGEERDPCQAPELKSKAYIGPANDLWSCGVLLSTLLAGECVVMSMQASFTSREFREAYKKWKKASERCKSLALTLMASNIERRPTVEKCLQLSWMSVASDFS